MLKMLNSILHRRRAQKVYSQRKISEVFFVRKGLKILFIVEEIKGLPRKQRALRYFFLGKSSTIFREKTQSYSIQRNNSQLIFLINSEFSFIENERESSEVFFIKRELREFGVRIQRSGKFRGLLHSGIALRRSSERCSPRRERDQENFRGILYGESSE